MEEKGFYVKNQNLYRDKSNNNISMHSGDWNGSLDDCLPCFIFIDDGFLKNFFRYSFLTKQDFESDLLK